MQIDYERRVVLALQGIAQQHGVTINNSNDKLLQEELFHNNALDLKSTISNMQKEKENKTQIDKRHIKTMQDTFISNHVTASAHAVWRNIAR